MKQCTIMLVFAYAVVTLLAVTPLAAATLNADGVKKVLVGKLGPRKGRGLSVNPSGSGRRTALFACGCSRKLVPAIIRGTGDLKPTVSVTYSKGGLVNPAPSRSAYA